MRPEFEPVELDLSCTYFLVSYVDILGQGAPLHSLADLNPGQAQSRQQIFSDAITRIHNLRRFFRIFAKAMADDRPIIDDVAADRIEHYGEFRHVDAKVHTFSDSLILTSRLNGSTKFGRWVPMNTINAHLYGVAGLSIMALAARIPLRIGVSLSIGIEFEGEYLGPALGEAYDLEHNEAAYPRVVVHPRVRRLLASHASRLDPAALEPKIDEAARDLARETIEVLRVESPNFHMLDVLHPRYVGRGGILNPETVAMAREFAIQQHAEHQAAANDKLTRRYSSLLTYFDERPEAWLPTSKK